jgi:hypothetical protein
MRLYRPTGIQELRLIAAAAFRAFRHGFRTSRSSILSWKSPTQWRSPGTGTPRMRLPGTWDSSPSSTSKTLSPRDIPSRWPVVDGTESSGSPAEDLPAFNDHILGTIKVIASYAGAGAEVAIDSGTNLPSELSQAAVQPGVTADGATRRR